MFVEPQPSVKYASGKYGDEPNDTWECGLITRFWNIRKALWVKLSINKC